MGNRRSAGARLQRQSREEQAVRCDGVAEVLMA